MLLSDEPIDHTVHHCHAYSVGVGVGYLRLTFALTLTLHAGLGDIRVPPWSLQWAEV